MSNEITLTFSSKDIELILDALSYVHWNDRGLTNNDRDYINGLYESIDNAGNLVCV